MSSPSGERDHRDDDVLVAYRQLIAEVYELAGRSRRSSDLLAREIGQTAARWHLMSALTDGPRSVSGAARRLGLARQSVQRVANELVRGGLVRSEPDPDDARAPRLRLTEVGRRVTSELFARSDERRAGQLARAGLTSDDLVSACIVVRRVCSAIEAVGGHDRRTRRATSE